MPSSSSEGDEIRLNPVEGCFEEPPDGFIPFDVECIPIQDFNPGDIQTGGRTLLVTPYVKGSRICSGQYGQFQVLQGLGGQIDKALYVGESIERIGDAIFGPGYQLTPDCDDAMEGPTDEDGGTNGDKGLAIRDRGRWYVVKLAQGGGDCDCTRTYVEAWGGQNNPYTGTDPDTYKIPSYRPFIFPRYKDNGLLFGDPSDLHGLHALPDGFSWDDNQDTLDKTVTGAATAYSLPYGLGWARLSRPTRLGKYAWDANYTAHHFAVEEAPDAAPTFGVEDSSVAFIGTDKDEIILPLSEPLSGFYDGVDGGGVIQVSVSPILGTDAAPPGTSPVAEDFVTLTAVSNDGDPAYVAPVIQRLVLSSSYGGTNEVTIELDRVVDFNEETISVAIRANFVVDTSSPKQANAAGSSQVYYKDAKFRFLPVINYSDGPMIRREIIEISGEAVSLTFTSDGNTVVTTWYAAFAARKTGEYPYSVRVIGGNAGTKILAYTGDEVSLADWQEFNYNYPYACVNDMPDFNPDSLPIGFGYFQEDPMEEGLYGEAECKDRMGFVVNAGGKSADRYTDANDSRLTQLIPRFVPDGKNQDVREWRLLWEARKVEYFDEPVLITIGPNNDLTVEGCDVEIKGLGFVSTPVLSVPTSNPNPSATYSTGLCSGNCIFGTVWVSNLVQAGSEVVAGLARPLVAGTSVWAYQRRTIPVDAGGYTQVYIVG